MQNEPIKPILYVDIGPAAKCCAYGLDISAKWADTMFNLFADWSVHYTVTLHAHDLTPQEVEDLKGWTLSCVEEWRDWCKVGNREAREFNLEFSSTRPGKAVAFNEHVHPEPGDLRPRGVAMRFHYNSDAPRNLCLKSGLCLDAGVILEPGMTLPANVGKQWKNVNVLVPSR